VLEEGGIPGVDGGQAGGLLARQPGVELGQESIDLAGGRLFALGALGLDLGPAAGSAAAAGVARRDPPYGEREGRGDGAAGAGQQGGGVGRCQG
jgi:hypothetical protein